MYTPRLDGNSRRGHETIWRRGKRKKRISVRETTLPLILTVMAIFFLEWGMPCCYTTVILWTERDLKKDLGSKENNVPDLKGDVMT